MPRTVLVVDDSAAFRATAQVLLRARGYEVVGAAGDLAAARAAADELRPDCVLLDVNLPDGDGVQVAATFAADVVLVSTLDLHDDVVERSGAVLLDANLPEGAGVRGGGPSGAAAVLASTLDLHDEVVERWGARGFVPKAELASPKLVELLGPP